MTPDLPAPFEPVLRSSTFLLPFVMLVSPADHSKNAGDACAFLGDRLRIACTGYVEANAGSVAAAGHVILRELLRRGHEVDFFGKPSFVYPRDLLSEGSFRLVDTPTHRSERLHSYAERVARSPLWLLPTRTLVHRSYMRAVTSGVRREHAKRGYDTFLSLGEWAFGRVPGLPNVSWVQGPPGTDARSVIRHGRVIRRYCGLREYLQLRAFTAWRLSAGLPDFAETDHVLCGSNWSAGVLASYGIRRERVNPAAYPIDLATFTPGEPHATKDDPPTLLWLGRVVLRKRLDLFLHAGETLIRAGREVRLVVVGGFAFCDRMRRMLDEFPYPQALSYRPGVERQRVPDLLRRATCLVAPSEDEDFGSSAAEAAACGTLSVLGPTNGTAEWLGSAAERFDAYTPESVASAIVRALCRVESDPVGTRTDARLVAERAFSSSGVVDRVEALLVRSCGTWRTSHAGGMASDPALTQTTTAGAVYG